MAEKYISVLTANHREQEVCRARLIETGENPNPPAD
jgi:hypothetical protein